MLKIKKKKLNIQKTKITASSPITSWQIDGETMETVTDYFLGPQNHCDGECCHEIKRYLLLGRKAMTKLDSVLKSRAGHRPIRVRSGPALPTRRPIASSGALRAATKLRNGARRVGVTVVKMADMREAEGGNPERGSPKVGENQEILGLAGLRHSTLH